MDILISVITASYNSVDTIEQAIKSVVSQNYSNIEYIIIDGKSTDGTLEIIKSYASMDSRIKYITEEDAGIYDAMNKGIGMATGNIIGLLNSDDYYEPSALENIVKNIPNSDLYVVYGMVRIFKNEKEDMVALYSHNSLPERMMMHPACFVSNTLYKRYKYDTSYLSAADYDLFVKFYNDSDVMFIPVYEIIANFRLGGMSSSVLGYIETTDIRYKYGFLTKRQHDLINLGLRLKRWLISR